MMRPYNCSSNDNDHNDSEDKLNSDLILLSLDNMKSIALLYSLYCENKLAADTWQCLYDLSIIEHPRIALNGNYNFFWNCCY